VDSAGRGRDDQSPATVFLEQPWGAQRRMFTEGVRYEASAVLELTRNRKNLTQERVARVTGPHPGDVATGNTEPECCGGRLGGLQKRWAQTERRYQVLRRRDRISQIRLPAGWLVLEGCMRSGMRNGARSLVRSGAWARGFSVVLAGGG
jgi:hypothetical protein